MFGSLGLSEWTAIIIAIIAVVLLIALLLKEANCT